MSDSQTAEAGGRHAFQAEVAQVLDIVINSLYSHREVFLRELISNASDAIDKLRFRALTAPELLGEDKALEIRLVPDAKNRKLTIADTGIGMTRDELVQYLGTIAHSGSRQFKSALGANADSTDVDLIGQFGVGFYSAFIVADRVVVRSRAAGAEEAWTWESDGRTGFDIRPDEDLAGRGTSIELFLKEDADEFLQEWKLKELVRRYSDFVSFPIKLSVEREDEETKEKTRELQQINKASALWRRPKADVTTEEYAEFYKHVAHDWEEPLRTLHFRTEGTLEFSALLFLPKNPPFDLHDPSKKRGVKLYVKRVFIMDDCELLLPEWLRFVRGVVDSDDLPLNVSREMLQEDRVTRQIRTQLTKRVLDAIEELATVDADYATFWAAFGSILKEGFYQDYAHRDRLSKLLRFPSSKEELTSLAAYKERMPEEQAAIYYAIGVTRATVAGSPHIEALRKRGFEVLYLADTIDDWVVSALDEFDGKPLVSAMKADLDLSPEDKEAAEKAESELKDLVALSKEVLDEQVAEVRLSSRLTDSPACLVVSEGGMHAHIERLLRAQGRDVPSPKRILELNPSHPLIQRIEGLRQKGADQGALAEWVRLVHDQAVLAEGSPLADPQAFAQRLSKLMLGAMTEQA